MDRVILHCDCNSFFASVETVLNPKYKNVPMAVCGSVEDRHGIVLAKNELAKKYGVQTAETVYSAKKKCPGLVIAEPHHNLYVKYSEAVNAIYREYTELVEPFGIDESWLDVTASGRLFGSGEEIAELIRNRVKRETGLTVSIGVSFNKIFAKLGSDYKKPDAVTVISKENFKEIVYPLPASDLLFVGKRTADELKRFGVRTIGDLASLDLFFLEQRFGKMGPVLSKYARGEDDSPVTPGVNDDVKSIGNGYTFKHDLVSPEQCRMGIDFLCEEVGSRLRKKGLKCSSVSLTIKDEHLISIQRQAPQSPPSDIGREIADTAYSILIANWQEHKPIRMLTVTANGLTDKDAVGEQFDFFASNNNSRNKLRDFEKTVDNIRQKYGDKSIVRGYNIKKEKP